MCLVRRYFSREVLPRMCRNTPEIGVCCVSCYLLRNLVILDCVRVFELVDMDERLENMNLLHTCYTLNNLYHN